MRTERLPELARFVARVTRERYPDLAIPLHSRWRHLCTGGIDRWARMGAALSREERCRVAMDLVVPSVLLDAGAGDAWRYREAGCGAEYARSEGLAVGSFDLFAGGALSRDPSNPLRADADALCAMDAARLRSAFQVDEANRLEGLEGRVKLLRSLGEAMRARPDVFGDEPRIGHLYDFFRSRASVSGLPSWVPASAGMTGNVQDATPRHSAPPPVIPAEAGIHEFSTLSSHELVHRSRMRTRAEQGRLRAAEVLDTVLEVFAPIWPGRVTIAGVNLGDVWPHPAIVRGDETNGLVPFHKLSQWLAYSLVEPLRDAGLRVEGLEELTALAEYRNGGLFVDGGVLEPRDPAAREVAHAPGSEVVVEWRALSVALIDRLAPLVRRELGADEDTLPLGALLEGGTWAAGRRLACAAREGGGPPIRIVSDGTVF